MNNILLRSIVKYDGFIIPEEALVDETLRVFIRPLYIEKLYLDCDLINELADNIADSLFDNNYEIIYAIEASVLPLAALVAERLRCSLSIIRKPRNFHHEEKEPNIFYSKDCNTKKSLLLDDAIWSGYTINNVLSLTDKLGIMINDFYFVFDMLDFRGGFKLRDCYRERLKKRKYWVHYKEIINMAYSENLISKEAYINSLKLFTKTSHP